MEPHELINDPGQMEGLPAAARECAGDAAAGIGFAAKYVGMLPLPGHGRTLWRWHMLAAAAAADLTAARILEAHSDALAILGEAAEAGEHAPGGAGGIWGVFAAEAPGTRLLAERDGGGWRLSGVKPWCSLAGELDHALVSAHASGGRRLFAVNLHDASVHVDPPEGWSARGLRQVPSVPVRMASTPARAVGPPGWYLQRPGFAWGGMGVAACWFGGALAIAARLRVAAARRPDDELTAMHVSALDVALHAAATVLRAAADSVDAGEATGPDGALLADRVRAVVARAAEESITRCGHALGPAPLAFDEEHARRVADLSIYLRQHHAERDLARIGHAVASPPGGQG